jgi:signal transduction histidine kinase
MMHLPGGLSRLRPKLLLSYLLIVAVTIVVLTVGIQLLGPPLFDRLQERHMGADHGMMGTVANAQMRSATERSVREALFQSVILTTVVATLAALSVSAIVSRRIADPVTDLARVSRRIASGNYRARADVGGQRDEIGELAASFNDMAAALEDAELRRSRVIGDVAHELRTPLATLSGYLEGLSDGVIEPSDDLWAQLRGETARLQQLVDDLQDLSRAEAGTIAIRPAPTPPDMLVQRAVDGFALRFENKGVHLAAELTPGIPEVLADEDRTIQVLNNLLSNALRHTPPGGRVTVSAAQQDGQITFTVTDTGNGIAAEHLPYIFDRFYRADTSRSREGGGSGIGLTIARALVAAQGGEIVVTSAGLGQGSTFTFSLPMAT